MFLKDSKEFRDTIDPVWIGLGACRQRHSDNKLLEWVRLAEDESLVGDLCGVRIYRKGLIGRSEYAQVFLGFQSMGYTLQVWKKRHEPVVVFATDQDTTASQAAVAAIAKFEQVVDLLAPAALDNRLDVVFPKAWVGRSVWRVLMSRRGSRVSQ